MLAFPHPGSVRTEFMMSVVNQNEVKDNPVARVLAYGTGPVMSKARNAITRMFLDGDQEWLWMVDTDIEFSIRTLPALLAAADPEDTPVVSGVYYSREKGEEHPIAYGAGHDDQGRFRFGALTPELVKGDGVLQVAAVGAGCLLMHRNAFKRINGAKPGDEGFWWAEMIIDQELFGEDMSFCLRCAMAEVPVLLHCGVRVGHVKTDTIGDVSP
jgi:GT2 family glycosyltransferase